MLLFLLSYEDQSSMELMFFCQDSADLKKLVDVLKQFFQSTAGKKYGMQNYVNPRGTIPLKEVDCSWDKCLGFLVVSHTAGQDTIQSLPQSQNYSNKLNLPAGQFRQQGTTEENGFYLQTLLQKTWKD